MHAVRTVCTGLNRPDTFYKQRLTHGYQSTSPRGLLIRLASPNLKPNAYPKLGLDSDSGLVALCTSHCVYAFFFCNVGGCEKLMSRVLFAV